MGILDDAIRQHLDLKRQRGATESELKELEDEAFGPPGRPGDADLPGVEEPHEQSGNGLAETAVAEPAEPEAMPEPTPEPSADEHAVVEPPPEPVEPPVEAGEPEPTAESEELTTIYDHTSEREPELDQLEMEPEPEAPGESAAAEAPVESQETVEHALPEEEAEPEEPVGEEPPPEPDAEPESEGGAQGDDVLADTPDFLRDAPEDDDLWFEQGKPKDFDF
jgi:hypothetical protein